MLHLVLSVPSALPKLSIGGLTNDEGPASAGLFLAGEWLLLAVRVENALNVECPFVRDLIDTPRRPR